MSKVFPSIIPDGDEFVDDSYSRQELERKEYPELKSLAADHPSEDVHGKMSAEDIIDGLVGKTRL